DHLHVVVDAEEVGHVADHAADVFRAVIDRVPADARLAPRRVQERGEDAHGRRLAGAVGADEAVDVALFQFEREPVEGVQVAVGFREVAGFDHDSSRDSWIVIRGSCWSYRFTIHESRITICHFAATGTYTRT